MTRRGGHLGAAAAAPPPHVCKGQTLYPRDGEGHDGRAPPEGWWRKPRAGLTAVRTLACGVPETVCAEKRVHVCCSMYK